MTGQRVTRRGALGLGAATAVVVGTAACAPGDPGADPPGELPPVPEAALPHPGGAPLRRGTVHDVRADGAAGDGSTDDTAAFAAALARAAPGDTVAAPAGTYRLTPAQPLRVPPGVLLAGDPGATVLAVTPGATAAFLLDGADVALDGLEIARAADVETVLLRVGRVERLSLSRLVLRGGTDVFTTFGHGIQLGTADGVSTGLALRECLVVTCTYGLYQANESRAVTVGVDVTDCTFARGTNSDLEFNAPNGSFRGVRVSRCTFRDNDSPGFAVGIAYCADVVVAGCSMTNYRMEAVHVEDWSSDVTITGCTMTACGLREFAHVQLIQGVTRVTLRGNRHDATANVEPIPVVGALAGGSGLSAGGRPVVPPTAVTVVDNEFRCSDAVTAVSFAGVSGGAVTGNRIVGIDPAAAIVLDGTEGVVVAANGT